MQKQVASSIFWKWPGEVTTTLGKRVWTRNDGVKDFVRWQDEVHEEADNRMLAHVKDVIESSFGTKILIRTSDTDVVVLFVAFFEQFIQYNEDVDIWIDFGSGDYRRFISINRSYNLIGDSISLGIPFFHAFSGCDSTCSFYRKTKKTIFEHWLAHPDQANITTAFQQLSWQPTNTVVEVQFPTIEKFVVSAFCQSEVKSVDEARFDISNSNTSGNLRDLPPHK